MSELRECNFRDNPKILILGHSFVRRLNQFVSKVLRLIHQFFLKGAARFKWHGVGGRTVATTLNYDLQVVASFKPDIVILQLGTNDLSQLTALVVGSALEDLVRLLHDSHNVKIVCVCQTIYREANPEFNERARALTKFLKVFLEPLPYSFFWGHRGFWNATQRFLTRDGVHLNQRGQYKFYRSLRGAVLKSLRLLGHMGQ